MEVILEPGDTIFVPAMWPHEVWHLGAKHEEMLTSTIKIGEGIMDENLQPRVS